MTTEPLDPAAPTSADEIQDAIRWWHETYGTTYSPHRALLDLRALAAENAALRVAIERAIALTRNPTLDLGERFVATRNELRAALALPEGERDAAPTPENPDPGVPVFMARMFAALPEGER